MALSDISRFGIVNVTAGENSCASVKETFVRSVQRTKPFPEAVTCEAAKLTCVFGVIFVDVPGEMVTLFTVTVPVPVVWFKVSVRVSDV